MKAQDFKAAPITETEIQDAQKRWGDGLLAISRAYLAKGDYKSVAKTVLDELYGYDYGPVLFKPTLASEVPLRFTETEALSYFVGGYVEEDTGFALHCWEEVTFSSDGAAILNGATALWMGSVYLRDALGETTQVEKTLGWFRGADGTLKLQLHHSSINP